MKSSLLIIIFLCSVSFGQNLVPNPSFEVMDTCPSYPGQIALASPWFSPTSGSTDYFSTCSVVGLSAVPSNFIGYENAKTGISYAGFFAMFNFHQYPYFLGYREYLEIQLDSVLESGVNYFVSFYVSLADSSNYATSNIGAYFSLDTLHDDTTMLNLPVTPQVENVSTNFITNKTGWTLIYGQFTASGGEKFVTIGNFRDFNNTDTLVVSGGGSLNMSDYYGGYYYIDDICVSIDSMTCFQGIGMDSYKYQSTIKLYPNPTYSHAMLEFSNPNNDRHTLKLFNQQGQLIKTICDIYSEKFEIIRSNLPSGLYYFQLWTEKEIVGTGRLIFE